MIKLGCNETIPAGWRWVTAQDVMDVRDGTHDTPQYVDQGVPLVTSKNLVDGEIDFSSCQLISFSDHEQISKRSRVDVGDILYAMIGTIGNPVVVSKACEFSIKNVALFKFSGKEIYNRFFYHFLNSAFAKQQFSNNARGGTQKFVSLGNIRGLQIPLPPLAEQKRIAAILDKADALRRKRQQAIELADQFLRSVFLDMFGAPESYGWAIATVDEVAKKEKGSIRTGPFGSQLLHSEFTEDGISVLGIDNAVENRFRWAKPRFISAEKYQQLQRYTVNPGDVLITIMGTCGRCAVVPDGCPTAINTKHLCCITLDQDKCIPEFLHSYFLYHPYARKYLAANSKGAIMEGLNMGIIKGMPVPLVPLNLQNKYLTIKQKAEKIGVDHAESLADIEACFASLSQKAFSGKL